METFKQVPRGVAVLSLIVMFGLGGPIAALAASDPGLASAATFSVLAQTAITGTSTISGNVGINSTGAGITALTAANVGGTIYSTNGAAPSTAILPASVQADASTAYTTNIPGQSATGSIGPVLDGLIVTPGVYDIGAGRLNGGILHLNGPGIYIFRASSDLISSGSISLENGARACDVYWRVQTLATINGSSFTGTILAGTGVHFGANVALDGRALAVGGDVTLSSGTISGPSCAAPPPASSPKQPATINVVKVVVNDSGGTKVVGDFPLFVNGTPVVSGVTNTFPTISGIYSVTETGSFNYTRTFSGDCDLNGQMNLTSGQNKFCIVTNNDIGAPVVPPVPPLIDVVKTASPLALPDGPGPVTYTYTLRNIGTVPVTNVTMVGDTCSPINLVTGDTNGDSKLDINETWTYRCSTTLSATHTNTVTATGWANGISAVDIATATVIVGAPIVPPLIHVTKVPNPLTLVAGGGPVTYTEKITNPGTVALTGVTLTDNTCSPMNYVSGDTNGDSKLDATETWTYTCTTRLTKTMTNTAIATGTANGLTVRDFAIATVTVGVAKLPNTGLAPEKTGLAQIVATLLGILMLVSISLVLRNSGKQT